MYGICGKSVISGMPENPMNNTRGVLLSSSRKDLLSASVDHVNQALRSRWLVQSIRREIALGIFVYSLTQLLHLLHVAAPVAHHVVASVANYHTTAPAAQVDPGVFKV